MAFKRFFIRALLITAAIVAVCVAIFVALDEFGLFRSANGRMIGIYTSERTAKYFLSMRYVPENFDAILVGPSLSDQVDTQGISAYRMYNLSLLGGNAVELNILVQNVLKRKPPKAVIICLDPFIVRSSGLYDARMTPRIRWTALGSTFMIEYYVKKIKKQLSGKKELFEYTEYGAATINELPKEIVAKLIADGAAAYRKEQAPFTIDQRALEGLADLVSSARRSGARIYAYYYPHPEPIYEALHDQHASFKQLVAPLFRPEDQFIDFGASRYKAFRENPANYVDAAHISRQGAAFLASELNNMLSQGGNIR